MKIRGHRNCAYPGGRWPLWGSNGAYTLATIVSDWQQWHDTIAHYCRLYRVLHARRIA